MRQTSMMLFETSPNFVTNLFFACSTRQELKVVKYSFKTLFEPKLTGLRKTLTQYIIILNA
ncbi:hypothetical protein A8L45_19100 [Veronia pacifica]|uniref:Uncharacterized protein n=1 Tax=Veronia pacifica TaxID=1080227 RepID=A0A1C3ECA5_9GAMM|nr:hypothetical protein A8L45_19100 [Veronia pacifica]